MSYDLAVWKSGRELTPEEALEVYLAVNDLRKHPDVVPAKAELDAFLKALKKRCREGYDVERGAGALILTIGYSCAEQVAEVAEELAREHGLFLYDPQGVDEEQELPFDDSVQVCPHLEPLLENRTVVGKLRGRSYGDGILVEGRLSYANLPPPLQASPEHRLIGCPACWCSLAEFDFYRDGWP